MVATPAPLEVVVELVRNYFLDVEIDRTIPPELPSTGSAVDLIEG